MPKGKRLVSVYQGPDVNRTIEIEDFETSEIGDSQVLVKVSKSQVSAGSEKGYVTGMHSLIKIELEKYHNNPGYTTVGHVLEAGKSMSAFKPGDRVLTYGNHASHWVTEPDSNPSDPIKIQHIDFDITDEQAAMARLGDVALHCIRPVSYTHLTLPTSDLV